MKTFQHTILNKRTISGVGLHTGKVSILKFLPAKINFGIKFQRIDLKNKPIIQKLIKGENISIEQSDLSKREWNELMTAFDLKDKLI